MLNKDQIENIFKNKLEGFEQTPSNSVWSEIEHKMFLKRFIKYKPLGFNLWNIIALIVISVSVILYNYSGKTAGQPDTNNTEKPISEKISLKNESEIAGKNLKENHINNTKTDIQANEIKNRNNKKQEYSSENQISDKETEEKISDENKKENYTNSDVKNEAVPTVKLAEQPHAIFSVTATGACEPAVITFFNSSENCDTYHWDFGNGEISSQKNPTFVFRTAGTYNVTLTVTSGSFSDVCVKKITIYPKPNTDFEITKKSRYLFNNEDIQFLNTGSGYSKCIWNFGDNNTSTYTNPAHIYKEPGNYKVSLICISDRRCADTAYMTNVYVRDSKYKIKFPTAFSPDKNAQNSGYWKNTAYPNSIFYPVVNTEISNYRLRIYNKNGALVFESSDLEIGWNGFYNNSPAQTGVYIWECRGKYENGELFEETGNVTLLYLGNQ